MDVASSALSNAWLQAVVRIHSGRTDPTPVRWDERTMTDVIERALRHGNVEPQQADAVAPLSPGAVVDRLV